MNAWESIAILDRTHRLPRAPRHIRRHSWSKAERVINLDWAEDTGLITKAEAAAIKDLYILLLTVALRPSTVLQPQSA